jgi:hypothetical protein
LLLQQYPTARTKQPSRWIDWNGAKANRTVTDRVCVGATICTEASVGRATHAATLRAVRFYPTEKTESAEP